MSLPVTCNGNTIGVLRASMVPYDTAGEGTNTGVKISIHFQATVYGMIGGTGLNACDCDSYKFVQSVHMSSWDNGSIAAGNFIDAGVNMPYYFATTSKHGVYDGPTGYNGTHTVPGWSHDHPGGSVTTTASMYDLPGMPITSNLYTNDSPYREELISMLVCQNNDAPGGVGEFGTLWNSSNPTPDGVIQAGIRYGFVMTQTGAGKPAKWNFSARGPSAVLSTPSKWRDAVNRGTVNHNARYHATFLSIPYVEGYHWENRSP